MLDDPSIPRNPVYRVRRGPEPLTLRLLLIAGGLTGALALIVVAWSSIGHRAGGPVPVVQADSRPVRVKPANPGGMQIPGLGTDTGSGDTSASDRYWLADITAPFCLDDGHLVVPTGPGLGLEINSEFLRQNLLNGEAYWG